MPHQFFTHSKQVQAIIKGLNLTKSLQVSSILMGEPYTGKKSLISNIYPDAVYADGGDRESVKQLLGEHEELVITNFEKLTGATLDFNNRRIIAISNSTIQSKTIDNLFAFIYQMPSLRERPEDIDLFMGEFIKEIKSILLIKEEITIDPSMLDISDNIRSLKTSIYRQAFSQTSDAQEIQNIIYHYLYHHMKGKNDYHTYLPLYERPLIEAGLKKAGSQLKLAEMLGINRNTLRKKIHELRIH